MKHISNNSGFNLIELMVVVAIVGLLAGIAIPAYSGFVSKSRQAEAKTVLGAAHKAEMSYVVEAGQFDYCLNVAGYIGASGNTYYTIGFHADQDPGAGNPGRSANCAGPGAGSSFFLATEGAHTGPTTEVDLPEGLPEVSATQFTVSAVGRISKDAAVGSNTWSMDETGTMTLRALGI